MKTYMCDVCGNLVDNPMLMVHMQEIRIYGYKCKTKRVHLCECCLHQIAEISRKDGADNER